MTWPPRWTGPTPKPRPSLLERQDRKKSRTDLDASESKKVKARSGGRCEVFVVGEGRCTKRAISIHHMIGGWGKRARGPSVLAEHKQHVCDGPRGHHRLITGHVLQVLSAGREPRWDDAYERVR